MLQKTEAIVLHALKYSDNSLIVNVYTKNFGRLALIVHGINSRKSKFSKSLFQPLGILDINFRKKQNREIHYLTDAKVKSPNHNIFNDIIKSTIAMFIGEVLYKTLREEESDKTLYNYLSSAIQILNINETNILNFHLIFLLQFTRFLGIYPINHSDLNEYQPKQINYSLLDLMSFSLNELPDLAINSRSRALLLDSIMKYYADHIEGLTTINSLQVLHDVFS